MRISDWSSDVCSSDLGALRAHRPRRIQAPARGRPMSITVLKPGLLSSFQDTGRTGSQHLGVPVCGAMDARAHRLANLLAGNEADHATLEITLAGPTLRFEAPACFAIGARQSVV